MPQKKDAPAPDQGVIPPATPPVAEPTPPAPELKLVGLDYLGGQAIIGVPARDLAAKELPGLGFSAQELVNSGLYRPRYEEIKTETAPEPGAENK
jgi:hypothetical protein